MANQVLLGMEDISKSFPGVQALDHVSLEVRAGEILGFVGENGAGKSTLMKILSGVYVMDSGRLLLDGQEITIHNPHHAQQLGISIIYQEFNLMPNLTVAENVFIGREPATAGVINWNEMHRQTRELTDSLGIDLSPTATVRDLSVAQQQLVEIAKALSVKARLIIMDEPTSALTHKEVEVLFRIMRSLRARGLGVIFISHRLEEVFEVCDRITVLRDGQNVGTLDVKNATSDEVIRMMVGRALKDFFPKEASAADGKVVLEVKGLSRTGTVQDPSAMVLDRASFQLRRGEIMGLAGLVGSGRTEMARLLFGADPHDAGEVYIDGKLVDIRSPRDAIRAGIGFAPEDRKQQALILGMAVRENISLPSLGRLVRYGFVQAGAERQVVDQYIRTLQIRAPSREQRMLNLSGGNQQKVVIAKWLALEPKVLIMDEPTRGIDVGAKAEVHALMSELAKRGMSIIMISSEMPEVLAMSDRILVMREGRIIGEMTRAEATPEKVMTMLTTETGRQASSNHGNGKEKSNG